VAFNFVVVEVFTMPHAKSCCESMDEFVALHKVQLLASDIPEHFWNSLYSKLKFEVESIMIADTSSTLLFSFLEVSRVREPVL